MSSATIAMASSNAQRAYEFQIELGNRVEALRERVREAYMHIILLLYMNIVVGGNYSPGTPVDTGFARNSWVVGLNEIAAFRQPSSLPSAERDALRKSGAVLPIVGVQDGQTSILGVQLGDEVHLTSNAVYMGALEDGHSQQAPTGFIWLAIHAGPQIIDEVVREMLS